MSLCRRLRLLALTACVGLAAGLAGAPADAVEAPPGSTNFTPPAYVPNYFSNESEAFRGSATARAARTGAGPAVAAPASLRRVATASRRHPRYHARLAARARGSIRLARGRASDHRHLAHAQLARNGRASVPRHLVHAQMIRSGKASRASVAHAPARPGQSKAVAAKNRRAPARARHLARGRG